MDTQENKFVEITDEVVKKNPERYIPFKIGEQCVIKGYYFSISSIDTDYNKLILHPVGLADKVIERK